MNWIECRNRLGAIDERCVLHNVHQYNGIPHSDSRLVAHAMRELLIIGEEWETIKGACAVVQAYANMHHSGGSASVFLPMLARLLAYENLTPLTDDPAEWEHHGPEMWGGNDGKGVWQNIRNSSAFSQDGGKTYWLLFDKGGTVHESRTAGSQEETTREGGDENERAKPGSAGAGGDVPGGPGGSGNPGGDSWSPAVPDGGRDG